MRVTYFRHVMVIDIIPRRQFWRLFAPFITKLLCLYHKLLACRSNTISANLTRRPRCSKTRRSRTTATVTSYTVWIFIWYWNSWTILNVNHWRTLNCKNGMNWKNFVKITWKLLLDCKGNLNCKSMNERQEVSCSVHKLLIEFFFSKLQIHVTQPRSSTYCIIHKSQKYSIFFIEGLKELTGIKKRKIYGFVVRVGLFIEN